MGSHLSSIGFAVHDMESLVRLAAVTVERGERVEPGHIRWAVGGGAEVWAALDRTGRACGLQPLVAGAPRVDVVVADVLASGPCEATIRAEAGDGEALVVDVVAPRLLGGVALPARAQLEVALFAQEPGGDEVAVQAAEWRVNEVTGRRFAWARVRATGSAAARQLDLIAHPALLPELPDAGSSLRLRGELCGRLHDVAELPAPRRRLGRRRRRHL